MRFRGARAQRVRKYSMETIDIKDLGMSSELGNQLNTATETQTHLGRLASRTLLHLWIPSFIDTCSVDQPQGPIYSNDMVINKL